MKIKKFFCPSKDLKSINVINVNNFKKNLQAHSYTCSLDIPDQGEHAYSLCNNRSKNLAQLFCLLNPEIVVKFKRNSKVLGHKKYMTLTKPNLLN